MSQQIPLLIAISLLFYLIKDYNYLRIWITYHRIQTSIAKNNYKHKSRQSSFPTKRPRCPLCEDEKMTTSKAIPEPPPLIMNTLGRPRIIDTDMHYCPNKHCEYYGWIAKGNISGNGHPNSSIWRQMKCVVCGKYFLETQGTPFYRSKTSPETIILALKALAEGLGSNCTCV
jgi:transposase-like protein